VTLDAAKAFNEVLHYYGLSYKMLSNGVPPIFVKIITGRPTAIFGLLVWNSAG